MGQVVYKGYLVVGSTYADYLPPGTDDAYSETLYSGLTYEVDLNSASEPMVYVLLDPAGNAVESSVVYPGQHLFYTPTINGDYLMGFATLSGGSGSFNFTDDISSAGLSGNDRGTLVVGAPYSDHLGAYQVDGYGTTLQAGTAYEVDLRSATEPMNYAIAGSSGIVVEGTLTPGQEVSFTPTESGIYGIGIDTHDGAAGDYTFSIDTATSPSPAAGPSNPGNPGNPSNPSNPGNPGNPTAPPLGAPDISVADLTTGQTTDVSGNVYATVTHDSLVIDAQASNAFIVSGTGNDILQTTGSGINVLDDTGGAVNFEIGNAAAHNVYFLDASKDPVSWNTIANFHAGDFAVIYGLAPQDLKANAADNLGVPGYTGVTLETYQNGGAAFVTFAGHGKSDVGSSLATAFGTAPSGQSFLLVVGA